MKTKNKCGVNCKCHEEEYGGVRPCNNCCINECSEESVCFECDAWIKFGHKKGCGCAWLN